MSQSAGQRAISFCADDFGLSPAIDKAIVNLAVGGRLQAVSCITSLARWREAAKPLQDLPAGVSIGLHFVLTGLPAAVDDGTTALRAVDPSPGGLLMRALLGRFEPAAIIAALDAQLDRFEAATGRRPDHVDGHHHVHAMPGIAGIVRDRLSKRYGADLPWIRSLSPCLPLPTAPIRRGIIERMGRHQRRVYSHTAFRFNRVFGGVRNFREPLPYADLLAAQLSAVRSHGALIMCHPALGGGELAGDEIAAARIAEYDVLASPSLPELLARFACQLAPLVPVSLDQSSSG